MKKSRHMKKGLALAAAVTLLAACGTDGADDTTTDTTSDQPAASEGADEGTDEGTDEGAAEDISGSVTVWTYPLGAVKDVSWYESHIERFNEQYPNIDVEIVMQAFSNREEAILTALAGGNQPDVIYFNPDFIPKYVEEDVLVPLDDVRDWGPFVDSGLDSMTYKDQLWGAPYLMQFSTPYCNKNVLEESGIEKCPETWDEMREAAPKAKEAGYFLTEYQGSITLNQAYYQYLWQAGGEVLSEDGTRAAFNSPEGLEALEFIKEMVDNEWVPKGPLSVLDAYEQTDAGKGNLAYIMGANLVSIRQFHDPEIIETAGPMTHKETSAAGSVGAWSVMKGGDEEAAKALVEFMTEPEMMTPFLEETGYLPPREDITGLFEDDPQIAAGIDYLDTVRAGVSSPYAREIIDVLIPHIQAVTIEGKDPQEALDAAEEEVNALLARG